MPIPLKLDHVIERLTADRPGTGAERLGRLAGVALSRREARRAWPHVLEHKWLLSERLGRDVGLRVAAVDYFENIHG